MSWLAVAVARDVAGHAERRAVFHQIRCDAPFKSHDFPTPCGPLMVLPLMVTGSSLAWYLGGARERVGGW